MPAERTITETAKQRSLRVPLDHFRRRDPLVRVKLALSAAAAALACGYVAWLLLGGRAGARHASPGQVASVHAAWNDDCQSCHLSFRPLTSGAVDLPSLAGLGPAAGTAAHRLLVDQACEKCHAVAAHQSNLLADEVGSCASCHREHRGAAADIVRPADSACTRCHAEIGVHRSTAKTPNQPVDDVSRFAAAGHPAFRSLAETDPGNLKFNHWLHLRPGIAAAGARQPLLAASGQPVQLDCSNCHVPDASGASLLPISFERHCRTCHPLEIQSAVEGSRPLAVKHGLSAQELAAALDGLLWDEQRRGLPVSEPALDESGAAPLIPGRTLGANLAQKLGGDLLVRRTKAELAIAARCLQCHYSAADEPQEGLPTLEKTSVNSRWFQFARFDHAAHRHVADCRDCHADAYNNQPQRLPVPGSPLPDGVIAATDDERVMIAGLPTCAACHSPDPTGKAAARHDCAECHSYHNEHAQAGPGPRPLVTPVAFQAQSRAASPPVSRLATCAAAGCHGDAQPGGPAWRSSFSTWLTRDPHAQAADVLWTHRARNMTELLTPGAKHEEVLASRCMNCHATEPQVAAAGVHCDSCHGNSSTWLHTHYLGRPAENKSDLKQRAQTCLPCHVGPAGSGDNLQAVDHDLVAAGHPRLNFEFHAHFESLPAHWDRAQDEARLPRSFHFESWLAGQQQHSAQRRILSSYLRARFPGLPGDFALFDCASCHHALAAGRTSNGQVRQPQFPRGDLSESNTPRPVLVKKLLEAAALGGGSFDDVVQAYLAARALAADLNGISQAEPLRAALAELGRFLGRECFGTAAGNRPPSAYDSPQQLDRAALARHVQAVATALAAIQQP